MATCCIANENAIKYDHYLANIIRFKNISMNHAKCARIEIFEFKKRDEPSETYSAILDVRKLSSG